MKIRTKYILFVVTIHLAALVLSFYVFKNDRWIFLVAEILVLVSIYFSYTIYQALIKPLTLLVQGTESIRDRDFNINFIKTGNYEMDKLIVVYNDMMDRLRSERTLQEEQHYFLEKLIYTSPTGIMVLDFDGRVQQINPAAVRLLNGTEKQFINKTQEEITHPAMTRIFQMPTGTSATIRLDGLTMFKIHKSAFVDRGFPRHFVMMEALTAEIREAEKTAYEKVIRMMAHEVNNTVGAVNSIMQSALSSVAWKSDDEIIPDALQVAIDRNNNLNLFMRNFADLVRLPAPKKESVDLIRLLGAAGKLMEMRANGKRIRFRYELPSSPFLIQADLQQMEQAIINILKNAIEAIQEEGEITISLDPSTRTLAIIDNGVGISDDTEQRIFEPFFSTKRDGQGIGLMLIREILGNHEYAFSLKTSPEKLTSFKIQFNP